MKKEQVKLYSNLLIMDSMSDSSYSHLRKNNSNKNSNKNNKNNKNNNNNNKYKSRSSYSAYSSSKNFIFDHVLRYNKEQQKLKNGNKPNETKIRIKIKMDRKTKIHQVIKI